MSSKASEINPRWSAGGYTKWCRDIVEVANGDPAAELLFDSSIEEPSELLRERINASFHKELGRHYHSTFARGNPFVMDALAVRYDVPRDWITCTTGCSNGIAIIFQAYLGRGDHVVIERPYFDLLPELAASFGANISYIDREEPSYEIDLDRLAELIQASTRLIVLTNLHNPTGALLTDTQLRGLAELAERTGVPIVLDEVYGDFAVGAQRAGPAVKLSPMLISVSSLTKVHGLFALKCGWILARGDIQKRIHAVYDRFEFGLSKVAHAVAAAVLEDMTPFDLHWRSILATSRPVVRDSSMEMEREGLLAGAVPPYGCMYFPRLLVADDDIDVAQWLWENDSLAVAPGAYFGRPGHVRIGFGRRVASVSDGMDRLRRGLRRYRELKSGR